MSELQGHSQIDIRNCRTLTCDTRRARHTQKHSKQSSKSVARGAEFRDSPVVRCRGKPPTEKLGLELSGIIKGMINSSFTTDTANREGVSSSAYFLYDLQTPAMADLHSWKADLLLHSFGVGESTHHNRLWEMVLQPSPVHVQCTHGVQIYYVCL